MGDVKMTNAILSNESMIHGKAGPYGRSKEKYEFH